MDIVFQNKQVSLLERRRINLSTLVLSISYLICPTGVLLCLPRRLPGRVDPVLVLDEVGLQRLVPPGQVGHVSHEHVRGLGRLVHLASDLNGGKIQSEGKILRGCAGLLR